MNQLSVITSNPGKLREFKSALQPLGFEVVHLPEEVDEIQADTLQEVVLGCLKELKSRDLQDFVLDDSGLFIDALHGFPGVYSSYVLRTLGCEGILKMMDEVDDRSARFKCTIGADIDGIGAFTVSAETEGRILHVKRGKGGFGYDPIFVPDGFQQTFAEMPLEEKNGISHRGKAIRLLASHLKDAKSKEG